MCGRFSSSKPSALVAQAFMANDEVDSEVAVYNVAPTSLINTVSESKDGVRTLKQRKWGLVPFWAKDPKIGNKLFNARIETLTEKAVFRDSARRRRCLIPIDGYYEWQVTETGKQPWFITGLSGKGLVLAGLYEGETTTIVTAAATDTTSFIHDRRPVIVAKDYWDAWLSPQLTDPTELLDGLDHENPLVEAFRVGRKVGDVRNNSPDLKEPAHVGPGED